MIVDLLLNALQKTNTFDDNTRRKIAELILTKHVHLHEGKKATKSDPHGKCPMLYKAVGIILGLGGGAKKPRKFF